MSETVDTPFGSFALSRYPARRKEPLRAWCGADTLLLDAAAALDTLPPRVLTVNDEHGALSVPLATAQATVTLWTDSALAALAVAANREANQCPPIAVVWSTERPPPASLVLLRIPKQKAFLEYQLALLAAQLPVGAQVLAAGMDKHLPGDVAALMERYLGACERHHGRYKAHYFSARMGDRMGTTTAPLAAHQPPLAPAHRPAASPGTSPDNAWVEYDCPLLGGPLAALPNVFSRDRLDQGSRFLIEQLGQLAPVQNAVDLACGNGVLGLAALQQGVAQHVLFCDESAMALASARANRERLLPAAQAGFHHGDGLLDNVLESPPGGVSDSIVDAPAPELILCNPPFHLQHAVDDFAGRRLLGQAANSLAPGGHLCLVANRHLDYRPTLQRHFRTVVLAQNSKFRVYLARREGGGMTN
ncbi:50S rRNA methyltransferase [Kineobactrum sediminis]|uniref:50S rRNA methyltransferase n=1 Tax=Kineobactrum sediminis TaxID=1905677 RepID=A0A2N5Y136_9GAMM|nr:methyltransferase [Kineobactrum sediminis]PLW82107.1 50S rRNA methyltransferase [Kineobactrum sediminis]